MNLYQEVVDSRLSKSIESTYNLNDCPILARGFIDLSKAGGGLYMGNYHFLPPTLEVEYRVFSIYIDDGDCWSSIVGVYRPKDLPALRFGIPYTDPGILQESRRILRDVGLIYYNGIDWSEQGRQEDFMMDFDVDADLTREIINIFPEYAKKENELWYDQ